MELDFKAINQERVGYRLQGKLNEGPSRVGSNIDYTLHVLTFQKFIPPYSYKADSHKQVYENLEKALASLIEQQNTATDGNTSTGIQRSVMLDVLATATLQREAMMNSMDLIRKRYV